MTDKNIIVNAGGFEFSFTENEISAIDVLSYKPDAFCLLHNQKTISGEIISSKDKAYKVESVGERLQVQSLSL